MVAVPHHHLTDERHPMIFGIYAVQLDAARPTIRLAAANPLLAHLRTEDVQPGAVQGSLTPLVGRETQEANAHGRGFPQTIAWEPGALATAPVELEIEDNGLWRLKRET